MAVEQRIKDKIGAALAPDHLEVVNESYMHAVPPDSETHFKLVVVSSEFEGKRQLQRHQQIYQLLAEEMAEGVHALALHTYSPDEWRKQDGAPDSPRCLGGGR